MALVLMVTIGVTFSLQARFSPSRALDVALRSIMAAAAMIVLFHPDQWVAAVFTAPIVALGGYWLWRRRKIEGEASRPAPAPASDARGP